MKTAFAFATALLLSLPALSGARPLLIYGGEKEEVFLGILNGSDKDPKSIWHKSGPYGYKTFNEKSIWYVFSEYGGTFGKFSAFNKNAKHPPALYDLDGNFHGYLTVDESNPDRTRVRAALVILEYYDQIRRDVPRFYELYFESDDEGRSYRGRDRGRRAAWRR